MPATDRYQLIVETATRGEAELRRFETALNRIADVGGRAQGRLGTGYTKAAKASGDALRTMSDDAQRFGERVRSFIERPIASLGGVISDLSASGGRLGAVLGGVTLGLAGVSGGAIALVSSSARAARELTNLSASTGLSVNQVDRLQAVARLADFDLRNLNQASVDLASALRDAGGQGENTRQSLRELGVSFSDAQGKLRPLGAVLYESIEALSKIEDTSRRVKLSNVLGGEDAAARSQSFIVNFQKLNVEAERLGFGTREGLVKSLSEADRELTRLNLQWDLLKAKVAEPLRVVIQFTTKAADAVQSGLSTLSRGERALTAAQAERALAFGGRGVEGQESFYDLRRDALGLSPAARPPAVPGTFAAESAEAMRRLLGGNQYAQGVYQGFIGGRLGADSIQFRLQRLAEERSQRIAILAQGTLGKNATDFTLSELRRLEAEEDSLRKALERIERAKAGAELAIDTNVAVAQPSAGPPTLLRRPERAATLQATGGAGSFVGGTIVVPESDIVAANSGAAAAAAGQNAAYGAGLIQRSQQDRANNLRLVQSALDLESRRIQLLAGPGGEIDAINKIAQLRLAALEEERQLSDDTFSARDRQYQIEQERQLQILEFQRRQREAARESVGRTFDSLIASGSGGVGALLRSVGLSQARILAQNAGEGLYSAAGGVLGRIGQASGLGGLLRGTLFDPQNATQKNIDALDRNTLALERFGAGVGGGARSGGGGGLVGLVRSLFGGSNSENILNGASNSASANRNLDLINLTLGGGRLSALDAYQTAAAGTRNLRTASAISGLPINTSTTRAGLASNVTRGVGYAAAGAGAVFGAIDGFSRGGAQGAFQGSASVLGGLALIPGPQQPFLAAAALITGLGSMLFGDPKKRRDSELNRLISDAAYTEPTATDYTFDTSGRLTDYNRRGDLRSLPPIQVNVTTMDSKSFVDHAEDISNAVQQGILDGHSLVRTIQQEAFAL